MKKSIDPGGGRESPGGRSVEQTISLAWQAYGEARHREAEALCAQLVKVQPGHAHAWFLRGMAAAALGKPKQALKHYDRVKDAPDLLQALAQARGQALLALDRIEEALDLFQEALSYRSDDASTYYCLGVAKLRQGDQAEARRFFRHTTVLEPKFGLAHYELGIMALNAGQADAAVVSFSAAAEHLPNSPETANNLGLALQAKGDIVAAEASYRRALELNENYAEAWFNLGVLLRGRDGAQADTCLSRALKLKPGLREALADHGD